ncbi:MAG: nitrile hydratase accessory protein [Pseudomonadota bacterium]
MTQPGEFGRDVAPPMENGEVVFAAPWEGRVFAMAIQLCEQGHYNWAEFQGYLIEAVGAWDAEHLVAGQTREGATVPYAYFELFADALGRLLADRGLVSVDALDALLQTYRARPHDHDHNHGHAH